MTLGGTSVQKNQHLVGTMLVSVHCQILYWKLGFCPSILKVTIVLVKQNPMKQLGLQIPRMNYSVFSASQLKGSLSGWYFRSSLGFVVMLYQARRDTPKIIETKNMPRLWQDYLLYNPQKKRQVCVCARFFWNQHRDDSIPHKFCKIMRSSTSRAPETYIKRSHSCLDRILEQLLTIVFYE